MTKPLAPQVSDAPLVIIGGGGHTRVLIDVLKSLHAHIEGIVTEDVRLVGETIMGVKVIATEAQFAFDPKNVLLVNGVGNIAKRGDSGLQVREALATRYHARGFRFPPIFSNQALLSSELHVAEGVQILRGAVVQAGVSLAAHAIVNSSAVVEHDSKIGAYTHLAPAAVLCGSVRIGQRVHVGANATIIQSTIIGDDAVIGAGCTVRHTITANETFL